LSRVKGGTNQRRRHNKVLAQTKGHRLNRSKLFRQANESLLHALRYSYEHRRDRKGQFRRLWIVRINAAARLNGISYSQLMSGLTKANIEIDRKILADLAVRDAAAFAQIVDQAKAGLAA